MTRPAFRGAFCCRRIGRFTPATPTAGRGPRKSRHTGSGNLPPLVAGAVDHRSEQLRYPLAPHKWLAASDRDSPGLYADKDGDEAGDLSTQWA